MNLYLCLCFWSCKLIIFSYQQYLWFQVLPDHLPSSSCSNFCFSCLLLIILVWNQSFHCLKTVVSVNFRAQLVLVFGISVDVNSFLLLLEKCMRYTQVNCLLKHDMYVICFVFFSVVLAFFVSFSSSLFTLLPFLLITSPFLRGSKEKKHQNPLIQTSL